MSGGYFNHQDRNAKLEIFSYCYDETDKVPDVFHDREISEIVWDVFDLIHDFDWYVSGDTGEGQWNKAVHDFKEKWFTDTGRNERYDRYLEDILKEMRELLGIENLYCHNCEVFEPESDSDYGNCKYHKNALRHKWERACKDNFIKKEE